MSTIIIKWEAVASSQQQNTYDMQVCAQYSLRVYANSGYHTLQKQPRMGNQERFQQAAAHVQAQGSNESGPMEGFDRQHPQGGTNFNPYV